MKTKIVLFDHDGTIQDSLPSHMTYLQKVCKEFNIKFPYSSVNAFRQTKKEPYWNQYLN